MTGGLTFTGNEYLQNFAAKKTWAAMVWSGDLASSGSADQVFVFPTEGTMLWTDNMLIPKGAVNKYTAELMMNFVYDPAIAGQIANFVYYVSPVKGADAVVTSAQLGRAPRSSPVRPALPARRRRSPSSTTSSSCRADLETDPEQPVHRPGRRLSRRAANRSADERSQPAGQIGPHRPERPAAHRQRPRPISCSRPGSCGCSIFFILPTLQMFLTSVSTGSLDNGFKLTWSSAAYVTSLTKFGTQFLNSIIYGGLATAAARS